MPEQINIWPTTCHKHPRSRQIRWPRTNCEECILLYRHKHALVSHACGCAEMHRSYLYCADHPPF